VNKTTTYFAIIFVRMVKIKRT